CAGRGARGTHRPPSAPPAGGSVRQNGHEVAAGRSSDHGNLVSCAWETCRCGRPVRPTAPSATTPHTDYAKPWTTHTPMGGWTNKRGSLTATLYQGGAVIGLAGRRAPASDRCRHPAY